jgi:hypothetical protein
MINARLAEIEEASESKVSSYRLKTISRFREWLTEIDSKAEVIPINNMERLTNLMVSLKGEALNKDEFELVLEIVNW